MIKRVKCQKHSIATYLVISTVRVCRLCVENVHKHNFSRIKRKKDRYLKNYYLLISVRELKSSCLVVS